MRPVAETRAAGLCVFKRDEGPSSREATRSCFFPGVGSPYG